MSMEVQGFEELLKQLEKKGENVEEIKEVALTKGAKVLQNEIEKNCPVDETTKYLEKKYSPGQHLRDNIVLSKVYNKEYILVGNLKGDRSDFYYAKFIEFGTVNFPAKPFIEPSVIRVRDEVTRVISEEIKKYL